MESVDFYSVLGVSRDADSLEIRQAFKRLALTHHPDKVAEPDRVEAEIRFKEISEAYETLVDETLRAEYDAGLHSQKRWQDSYGGYNSYNYDMYGGSDGSYDHQHYSDWFEEDSSQTATGSPPLQKGKSRYSNHTEDAVIELEVPLEDIYKGRLLKLSSTRQVICAHCKGTGARSKATPRKCTKCGGKGSVRKLRPVAPGLATQTVVDCSSCRGTGSSYRSKDYCRRCTNGSGTVEERSIIEVYIPKAAPDNHRIVLEGKADEAIGKVTGDIVLVISVESHPIFRRENLDLYTRASISLKEALTGFSRPLINQLDGRRLRPTIPRGTIISPGQILKIPGEGLVMDGDTRRGDMYIQLDIEFPRPDQFDETTLSNLASVLPSIDYDITHNEPDGEDNKSAPKKDVDISHEIIEADELPSYKDEEVPFDENNKPGCTTA